MLDSSEELATAAEAQKFDGIVCQVDADNGTFVKTIYRDGKLGEWQKVYGADGYLDSETHFDTYYTSRSYTYIFNQDGHELMQIKYGSSLGDRYDNDPLNNLPREGRCGDGRGLNAAEIIAWIRGEPVSCEPSHAKAYRNLSAARCQYRIDDVLETDDKLMISKATSEPISGTLCISAEYRSGTYYYELGFTNGVLNGSATTYKGEILSNETIWENGEKILVIEYDYDERSETPYKNGVVEGVAKRYLQDGTLRREVTYKNGVRDGRENYYEKNGKLLYKAWYIEGKVSSVTCGNGRSLSEEQLEDPRDWTYECD
jgi:antitoxin component YwqK of YwqJK toxin-antitoxin module